MVGLLFGNGLFESHMKCLVELGFVERVRESALFINYHTTVPFLQIYIYFGNVREK